MTEKEIQGEGFTVKDKRAFDNQGKIKEEFEKVKEKKGEEKKKEKAFTPLPEISLSSFLLSISSSALLHLGEIADPQSGEKKKDLALAKQSVDIIALLKEKTKGNLTEEEEKLLEHLLYDLRIRFVQASEK